MANMLRCFTCFIGGLPGRQPGLLSSAAQDLGKQDALVLTDSEHSAVPQADWTAGSELGNQDALVLAHSGHAPVTQAHDWTAGPELGKQGAVVLARGGHAPVPRADWPVGSLSE